MGCLGLSRPYAPAGLAGFGHVRQASGARSDREDSGLKPLPSSRRLPLPRVAISETRAADSRPARSSPSRGGHHERSTPQPLVVRRRDCGFSRLPHDADIASRRFPTLPRGILGHRRRHVAGILHPDPPSRRHATQDGSGPPAGSQATKWVIPFLERV
jgi:hypothetical protein